MVGPKPEELITILSTSQDKKQVEDKIKEIHQFYSKNLSALIQQSDMIPTLAEWLKTNINSTYCSSIFKFIIRLYELMGFNRLSDINEYYRCHEKVFNKDPKFLSKSYLEGYDPNSKSKELLIDNPLLNFTTLHLALSVLSNLSKSAEVKKFKPTILILTTLISMYCYDSRFCLNRKRPDYFEKGEDTQDADSSYSEPKSVQSAREDGRQRYLHQHF
jgi:hypothetical protein